MRPKKYPAEIYRFIREHWRTMSDKAIAEHLQVISAQAVATIRHNAGYTKEERGAMKGTETVATYGEPLKRAYYTEKVHPGKIEVFREVR